LWLASLMLLAYAAVWLMIGAVIFLAAVLVEAAV
jgi:hypothetical protein